MPNDPLPEIERRLAAARPNGLDRRAIELVPFRDLTQPNLTSVWLVKNLIVAGSIALCYGAAGCGKTFLVLDLALAIATGREWFGRRTHRGRVVYIAAEAGTTIRNRIAAWTREKLGHDDADEVELDVVMSPVDLCHPKTWDVERLVAAIGAAQVVFIDTVSRAMAGGNENAPDDMGAFIMALDRLRAALECTVIAIHHLGKDGDRGSRGHSALTCAADTWIEVDRRGGVSVATVARQRDGPRGDEIAFWLKQVELGRDGEGDVVTSCVIGSSAFVPPKAAKELAGQAKQALDVLRQAVLERGDGARGVQMEVWREYMERSQLFGAGANFRNAWKRARERLDEGGHVQYRDGYARPKGATDFVQF